MAASDFPTQVYNRIWVLLERSSGFTDIVKPGNRIKFNNPKNFSPIKDGLQDGDVPEFSLMQATAQDNAFTDDEIYGRIDDPAQQEAWLESLFVVYKATIIHRDLYLPAANVLYVETLKAIRSGGHQMGLSFVERWGPTTAAWRVENTATSGTTLRLVTDLTIPVQINFQGNTED